VFDKIILMAHNHYELLPDGNLLVVPVVRSFQEVLRERTKVAQWFSKSEEGPVLMGTCSIPLLSGRINKEFPDGLSESVLMQEKIEIYNMTTADEIIKDYLSKAL
jgi:hypothetical protein